MSKVRIQYDEDFKKNAVKISHASPKTVSEVAVDLGIKGKRLYALCKKYTAEGDKTCFAMRAVIYCRYLS
jgi:transposase